LVHFTQSLNFVILETKSQKYDTKEQIEEVIVKNEKNPFENPNLQEISFGGNTYGREACDFIASLLSVETPLLTTVNFNDLFVSRKIDELPGSLKVLVEALMFKKVEHLNLSDNAFGPRGVPSFDFFLRDVSTLQSLRISNCGLGPVFPPSFL
jgi:Ran GTPase-activating protein 1